MLEAQRAASPLARFLHGTDGVRIEFNNRDEHRE
jgi:hypothetical protein